MANKFMRIVVLGMIGFLLGAWIGDVTACRTTYKWVCDSQGKCEWITVCE